MFLLFTLFTSLWLHDLIIQLIVKITIIFILFLNLIKVLNKIIEDD